MARNPIGELASYATLLRTPPARLGYEDGRAGKPLIYDFAHLGWPMRKSSQAYELGWHIGNEARRANVPRRAFARDGTPSRAVLAAAIRVFKRRPARGNEP